VAEPEWVTSAKISPFAYSGAALLLFWIWSVVGLGYNLIQFFSLPANVGVGTSAYLIVTLLIWIGGMVMLGVGALLIPGGYDFKRPSQ
jgi:hypothetical protein